MSCTNCTGSNPIFYQYNLAPCTTSGSSCSSTDSSTILYTGPNLTNIGSVSNSDLQTILGEIDAAIGEITGIDWASFDYFCLDESITIDSAQSFVEAISEYVCTTQTSLEDFIAGDFADSISGLQTSIDDLSGPGLTSCTSVGVTVEDNTIQVLSKILTSLCQVIEDINPEDANWNTYFATDPLPTSITSGFNVIIEQIGVVKTQIASIPELPTFDNTTSCIGGTAADSVATTVVAVRDYVCELPTFDIDNLPWTTCITNPNTGGGADLESTLSVILNYLNSVNSRRVVTWDPTVFDVTYDSPGDECSGLSVTLQASVGANDKLVALDGSDTDPDYLLTKMLAGDNITFDTATTPGSVIIDCTAEDTKVKADSGDASAGYLIDKIDGQADSSDIISIVETYNATTDKVDLTPFVDYNALAAKILERISVDNDLLATYCALACGCSPCPAGESRTVSMTIECLTGSSDIEFTIGLRQSSPTVAWFTSGEMLLSAEDVINTGTYTVTSASLPLMGGFDLTNNHATDVLYYSIYVLDSDDNIVSGSTSLLGNLAAAATLSSSTFSFGSVDSARVYVELSSAAITTTTTTTTTLPS